MPNGGNRSSRRQPTLEEEISTERDHDWELSKELDDYFRCEDAYNDLWWKPPQDPDIAPPDYNYDDSTDYDDFYFELNLRT